MPDTILNVSKYANYRAELSTNGPGIGKEACVHQDRHNRSMLLACTRSSLQSVQSGSSNFCKILPITSNVRICVLECSRGITSGYFQEFTEMKWLNCQYLETSVVCAKKCQNFTLSEHCDNRKDRLFANSVSGSKASNSPYSLAWKEKTNGDEPYAYI